MWQEVNILANQNIFMNEFGCIKCGRIKIITLEKGGKFAKFVLINLIIVLSTSTFLRFSLGCLSIFVTTKLEDMLHFKRRFQHC